MLDSFLFTRFGIEEFISVYRISRSSQVFIQIFQFVGIEKLMHVRSVYPVWIIGVSTSTYLAEGTA